MDFFLLTFTDLKGSDGGPKRYLETISIYPHWPAWVKVSKLKYKFPNQVGQFLLSKDVILHI